MYESMMYFCKKKEGGMKMLFCSLETEQLSWLRGYLVLFQNNKEEKERKNKGRTTENI